MMKKIITALDVAEKFHRATVRDFIARLSVEKNIPWNGQITEDSPVQARIDFGRWIADCECGGAEYVDPNEPIFFCMSCGNVDTGHAARRVIFPQQRAEIEAEVLMRQVKDNARLDPAARALYAKAVDGIPRSWNPGETVKDLKLQHNIAKAMKQQRRS